MSDFHNPPEAPVARKKHYCSYCAGPIPQGEQHKKQTGVFDGSWYKNRYHTECWDTLNEEGVLEFSPGEGEMPERVQRLAAQLAASR